MKSILVLFLAVASAIPHPATLKQEWNEYKESFGKFYTSGNEDDRRLNTYMETKRRVEEHNRKYERGETSFKMAINKFADWFPEELSMMTSLEDIERMGSENAKPFKLAPGAVVPKEINWVEKGAVTGVKNQGQCGSCYAFSSIGALEALMYIKNKTITDLSPQELIDCTSGYGNSGCKGGHSHKCFMYVKDRKGISTLDSYPYEAAVGTCRAQKGRVGTLATGYVLLENCNETQMVEAVGTVAPISIYYGSSSDFHLYGGGVYDGTCFNGSRINHAMLAVGYGKDKNTGKDYWLVKNSWGKSWGVDGYVKIIRGVGKCGIDTWSTYPVYEK